jgi:predicted GNAT superfamily acetyltransferase
MEPEIVIRKAETLADYQACQAAQRKAWGIAEDGYVVPIATMVGAQLHGGLVLGAFLPGGEAVGLSFAFLGRIEGRLGLYSQLTGVVPGYQDRGIGGRLKHSQRDLARADGLPLIAWAFDPLQAGNARFNLDKLGASAGRYVENMYGLRTDALNAGTPTDRLIVTWETEPVSRPSIAAAEARDLPRLIEAEPRPDGLLKVVARNATTQSPRALLEVPVAIHHLRAIDASEADRWRVAVREAFQTAFAAGFRAVGFLRFNAEGSDRAYYILSRSERREVDTKSMRANERRSPAIID